MLVHNSVRRVYEASMAILVRAGLLTLLQALCSAALAQEKIRLSHSALETSNAVWFLAQDLGIYRKYGVDTELLFIPSTTTSLTSLLAGDVHLANVSAYTAWCSTASIGAARACRYSMRSASTMEELQSDITMITILLA
jgi:ABC-type nitrate/sulfonate/bicarbonate transport system substrate-binding protein